MLLHDKNAPLALGRRPSEGLRSVTGGTLVAVALELVVGFADMGQTNEILLSRTSTRLEVTYHRCAARTSEHMFPTPTRVITFLTSGSP